MNDEALSRFRHKPLDHPSHQIRLVKLLPKSKGGLIQCTIRHENLGKQHIALSYVWGAPTPTRDILIDGKIFTIRKNLWDFLVRQDEHDRSNRRYWIDQISINQQDVFEKNAQVGMMGQIYRRAKKVFVWLGSADEEFVRAMGEANYSALSIFSEWNDHRKHKFPCTFAESARPPALIRINDRMAAALGGHERQHHLFDQFVSNHYWERAWTVPEFVLAGDLMVISGTSSISLRQFLNAYSAVMTYRPVIRYHLDKPGLTAFLSGRYHKWKPSRFCTVDRKRENKLSNLLVLCDGHPGMCEKQVDSIYSLLGVVDGECLVRPDYRKDARELFRDVLLSEYDIRYHRENIAKLIADRLGLDPAEELNNLMSYLGLETPYSHDGREYGHLDGPSHRKLKQAVQRERQCLRDRTTSSDKRLGPSARMSLISYRERYHINSAKGRVTVSPLTIIHKIPFLATRQKESWSASKSAA